MKLLQVYSIVIISVILLSGCGKEGNLIGPPIDNWVQANGLDSGTISSFVQIGENLIGGVGAFGAYLYISTDRGLNWKALTSLPCVVSDPRVHLHPIPSVTFLVDGTNLYAGVGHAWGGSVSISTDYGMTWSQRDTGFVQNVNSLAMIGESLFAGTDSGVFLSTNGGESWASAGQEMSYQVTQLSVVNGNLFAGTSFDGVFRYAGSGIVWSASQSGLTGESIYGLATIGSDLFAAAFHSVADSTNGVFISTDDGSTWNQANKGLTNHTMVGLLYTSNSSLFAAANGGIFLSTDRGESWTNISVGSPFDSLAVSSLTVYDSNLLVGASNGVWIGHFQ